MIASYHSFCLFSAVLILTASQQVATPGESGTEIRWQELLPRNSGNAGFTSLAPDRSGILFTNLISEDAVAANRVLDMGSGVAAGDIDGDGLVDLFFCSLDGNCRLFRNLGGLQFQDITASAGVACAGAICRAAVFVDIDGDSRQDLLVSAMGRGVLCFRNVGTGKFTNATARAGTASPFGSMTMTFADVDGNGTLDFYVTNYRTNDIRDAGRVDLQSLNGRTVVPPALQSRFLLVEGKVQEYGEPDLLYLNDGKGIFRPASWIDGRFRDAEGKSLARAPLDWGLTAAFHDLNGDGAPDLYVCNDYWSPDRIWINDGHGGFQAISATAVRHTSASSMGIDFADIDQDGYVDFFVVDMLAASATARLLQMPAYSGPVPFVGEIFDRPQINRNTLFHNRGDGSFEEIAEFARVDASNWSWQPFFMDVDLDGLPDLLVSTGHIHSVQDFDVNEVIERTRPKWRTDEKTVAYNGKVLSFQQAFTLERARQLRLYRSYQSPIVAFRNAGDLRFEDKTATWGLTNVAIRHGMALADLDNDGDLDLVTNPLNSAAEVFINQCAAPRIAVELRARAPNTDAIGAKVSLVTRNAARQTQEIVAGGRYLSDSQRRVIFSPNVEGDLQIEVLWRDGKKSVAEGVRPNRIYFILERDR